MLTSPDFAANLIGAFFHPDAVLAAHEAGTGFDGSRCRATAGEWVPAQTPDRGLPA